ncbi:MAG: restriction endonuclease subunit S [Methanobacteriaceae archaeon]|jgi:restriction endonuclease S subunit
MNYKPYPEYKDSGVEWVGEIPKDWEISRIKFLGKTLAGGAPNTEKYDYWDGNIPWLPSGTVKNKKIFLNDVNKFITELGLKNSATKEIKENSILVALTGATCGNIGYLTFKSTANQSVVAIENFSNCHPMFLFYYLMSQKEQILINKTGGAQAGINEGDVKNIIVTVPDIELQAYIASFLDKKTSEIDKTIKKDKQLIELLKEKRAALINHVVTKGLDVDAKMKDSGVEWIGEIPEGWEIKKLKYSASISNDKFNKKPENLPYIGLEHIKSFTGVLIKNDVEEVDSSVNIFKKGDILFGKLRPYLAKVVEAPFDGVCTTELVVFKVNNGMDNHFLFYQILSQRFIDLVNAMTYGVKMPRANPYQIENMLITVPKLEEQIEIAEYLDKETNKIDLTISKIQTNISLLQEYKKSLIHHAVTGKIDVRGYESLKQIHQKKDSKQTSSTI